MMAIRRVPESRVLVGRSVKTTPVPWYSVPSELRVVRAHVFTSLSTPATPNTKSAWTQLVASTSEDVSAIVLSYPGNIGGTDYGILLDVGVGASGVEVAVVQDLAMFPLSFSNQMVVTIPVRIPAGSRVAWRAQAAQASKSITPTIVLCAARGHQSTPTSVDTYGVYTSTSRATALTGTSGVTCTEIAASTSRQYAAAILLPSNFGQVGVNANVRLTLCVGDAGVEREVGYFDFNQSGAGVFSFPSGYPMSPPIIGGTIPAGSRLSVRHNIAANPGYVQASIIGVPFA
jgi:hypothetical protein